VEICPDAFQVADAVAKLVKDSGAALVIDYGDDRLFGNSLRVGFGMFLAFPA